VLKNSAYAKWLSSDRKYTYLTHHEVDNLYEMAASLARRECDAVVERRVHLQFLETAAKNHGKGFFVVLLSSCLSVCL
jgi:hypothetical protein